MVETAKTIILRNTDHFLLHQLKIHDDLLHPLAFFLYHLVHHFLVRQDHHDAICVFTKKSKKKRVFHETVKIYVRFD